MKTIAFFPGKDTPLKRYKSYFPGFSLKIPEDGEYPTVILCHSRGLQHAVDFCIRNNINPTIISMDGVEVEVTDLKIVNFCPVGKDTIYDDIFYESTKEDAHYPFKIKFVRDKIIKEIEKHIGKHI
jgi:hypothetical protein